VKVFACVVRRAFLVELSATNSIPSPGVSRGISHGTSPLSAHDVILISQYHSVNILRVLFFSDFLVTFVWAPSANFSEQITYQKIVSDFFRDISAGYFCGPGWGRLGVDAVRTCSPPHTHPHGHPRVESVILSEGRRGHGACEALDVRMSPCR